MKNLFVLSTDKQSVLYKLNKFDDEFFLKRDLKNVLNPLYLFYNIYITSYNQDVNENDYIITKDGKLVQVSYLLSEDLQGASKVILTTDQKLINDDVQAIEDNFLEWFVKNPSCEEVDVKNPLIANISDFGYKIIIPKEEPFKHKVEVLSKEEILANRSNAYEFIDFDKQETLEELKKWKEEALIANEINQKVIEKLMAEKKQMYSNEDIINALHSVELKDNKDYSKIYNGMKEWFEQNKKK